VITRLHISLLAIPVLVVLAPAYFTAQNDVSAGFTPAEVQGYSYHNDAILSETEIMRREPLRLAENMRGPISASRPAAGDGGTRKNAAGYAVTSIFIGDKDRWAVINDQIVREGDNMDGMKVLRIQRGRVELEAGGAAKWLRLEEE
jgi:hypothetical protein